MYVNDTDFTLHAPVQQYKSPVHEKVPNIKPIPNYQIAHEQFDVFPTQAINVQHLTHRDNTNEEEDLDEIEPLPAFKPTPPKVQRTNTVRKAKPDTAVVTDLSASFLHGDDVKDGDPELIAHAIVALQERRDELMLNGSFTKSLEVEKAINQAKDAQLQSMKKQSHEQFLSEIQKKRMEAENHYNQVKNDMKAKEIILNQRSREYLANTKKRHDKEMTDHDEHWRSEAVQRRYNRTSQELRSLRLQQQLLMRAKRFGEAEEVAKIAKAKERAECRESYKAMVKDFMESRRKVEMKHKEEMNIAIETVNRKKQEFQYFLNNMMKPYTTRMKNLENEHEEYAKESERVWNRKHRNEGNLVEQYVGVSRSARNVIVKAVNPSDFNVLKLPPLPIPAIPPEYNPALE